jgi:hypothetical protein
LPKRAGVGVSQWCACSGQNESYSVATIRTRTSRSSSLTANTTRRGQPRAVGLQAAFGLRNGLRAHWGREIAQQIAVGIMECDCICRSADRPELVVAYHDLRHRRLLPFALQKTHPARRTRGWQNRFFLDANPGSRAAQGAYSASHAGGSYRYASDKACRLDIEPRQSEINIAPGRPTACWRHQNATLFFALSRAFSGRLVANSPASAVYDSHAMGEKLLDSAG